MPKKGYKNNTGIQVLNKYKAIHINGLNRIDLVCKLLDKEYGLCFNEVRLLSIVYELIDSRYDTGTRHGFASLPSIEKECTFYVKQPLYKALRMLVNRGFLKIVKDARHVKHKGRMPRLYDIDAKGILLFSRYSKLMSEYYRENWYTKRLDRDISKFKLLNPDQDPDNIDSDTPYPDNE